MAQRVYQVSFHTAGTLAANHDYAWTVPFDCQLIHVSAVASNATDAVFTLGTTSSAAAYLASSAVGDSLVPAEYDRDDFVGGEFPHIVDGTVFEITLDYDGAGGTAAADFTIVLTFTEG
jgi:hypothetical protein